MNCKCANKSISKRVFSILWTSSKACNATGRAFHTAGPDTANYVLALDPVGSGHNMWHLLMAHEIDSSRQQMTDKWPATHDSKYLTTHTVNSWLLLIVNSSLLMIVNRWPLMTVNSWLLMIPTDRWWQLTVTTVTSNDKNNSQQLPMVNHDYNGSW